MSLTPASLNPTLQLQLYNGALRECGERSLASLTENRPPRLYLDEVWNEGIGAVNRVLDEGLWTFATRSAAIEYDPSISPPFGFLYGFGLPNDFIRTSAVCVDPYFNTPLTRYTEEAGFMFSDLMIIYVKYISNDLGYGANANLWSGTFMTFFELWLAAKVAMRVTQDKAKAECIEKKMLRARLEARSRDCGEKPSSFLPRGSWTAARIQNYRNAWGNGDGYGSSLIGS